MNSQNKLACPKIYNSYTICKLVFGQMVIMLAE